METDWREGENRETESLLTQGTFSFSSGEEGRQAGAGISRAIVNQYICLIISL